MYLQKRFPKKFSFNLIYYKARKLLILTQASNSHFEAQNPGCP